MKSLLVLASLPLLACTGGERADTGECPAGEVCSPLTPSGLHFIGADLAGQVFASGPAPTAIGGTQDVALQYQRGGAGPLIALDLPFQADDDGGAGVTVDHTNGSVVTLKGAGSRTNYLRIIDPSDRSLYDRKLVTGAALSKIALVQTGLENIPAEQLDHLVWATGPQDIGIGLYGAVQESGGPQMERLVDESMQFSFAAAERKSWDTLHFANAAPGTYPLSVTAGDKPPAPLTITIVDHADALTAIDPPTMINKQATVCFLAVSAGDYIVGLPWSFTVDGVTSAGGLITNCVDVTTTKVTGTVTVQAMAGGQSATVTLTATSSMTRELPLIAPPQRLIPTAGERAAL